MKLSARNQFSREVTDIRKGATTTHVRIEVALGVVCCSAPRRSPSPRRLSLRR